MRYCYLATGIRRLTLDERTESREAADDKSRDHTGTSNDSPSSRDINIPAMVQHISNTQSFQGGIGQGQTGNVTEPHSGLTYCGLSALKNVGELRQGEWSRTSEWLVGRQCDERSRDERSEACDHEEARDVPNESRDTAESHDTDSESETEADPQTGGFNGRVGKLADTCYSFWVSASLASLNGLSFVSADLARDYLLSNTQNSLLGGFAKTPGEIPDPLHSYLGVAALSIFGQPGLGKVVPELCISERALEVLTK